MEGKDNKKSWQARFYEARPLTSMILTGVIVGIITLIIGAWINTPASLNKPDNEAESVAATDTSVTTENYDAVEPTNSREENEENEGQGVEQSWLQKFINDENEKVQKRADIYSKAIREHPFPYFVATVLFFLIAIPITVMIISEVVKHREFRMLLIALVAVIGTIVIIWAGYDMMLKGQELVR